MIASGALNKKITLRSFTRSVDAYGEPIKTYSDYATVWASIEPIKGDEFFQARKETAEIDTKITLRYRRDIRSSWEIMYGIKRYTIQAIINPKNANIKLELMCKEVVD